MCIAEHTCVTPTNAPQTIRPLFLLLFNYQLCQIVHSTCRDNSFASFCLWLFVVVDEVQRGRKGSVRETTIETLKYTEIGNVEATKQISKSIKKPLKISLFFRERPCR